MYNAKIELLLLAQNWRKLIGQDHAVAAIRQSYEYISKVEVGIEPLKTESIKFATVYYE